MTDQSGANPTPNPDAPKGFGAHAWTPADDATTVSPDPALAGAPDADAAPAPQPLSSQQPYGQPAAPAPQYGAPQPPYGNQNPYASQDPYGQNPYAGAPSPYGAPAPTQAPYGAQQPNPYGAPNPYAAQNPNSGYGQPVAPNPYAYAPAAAGAGAVPARRSSLLGIIALVVVAVCGVAGIALSYQFGHAYALVAAQLGISTQGPTPSTAELQNDPRFAAFVTTQMGVIQGIMAVCVAGLVGWVLAIVATATRRGRAFGIIGIILGIAAPIGMFVAMVMAIASVLG